MNTALASKTVCVVDHGLFLSLALRLAREAGRVLYFTPDVETAFPVIHNACVGDGFEGVERVQDFWGVLPEVDLFVFPDVQHASLQLHLEDMGNRVWGSRTGDQLELRRQWFRRLQAELGLEVPPHREIKGLSALREYLAEHPGSYVKISRYRGITETFCYYDDVRGAGRLDLLARKLGPLQEDFPFLVEAPLDAVVETGLDTFCIDGRYPSVACQSIEGKDKTSISAVTPMAEMPPCLLEISEALAPIFRQRRYRNWLSTEVRIMEDKTAYLTDPTCRQASPVGESLLELIGNLGDIMWAGSEGELVEPEWTAKFAAQAIVEHPDDCQEWRSLELPESDSRWFKPYCACRVDQHLAFPPLPWAFDAVGSVVGLGDTIEAAIEALKGNAGILDGQGLSVHIPDLADTIKAIEDEEEAGVPFTDAPVPEPSIAIDSHDS